MRRIQLAVACVAVLVATPEQGHAGVILNFQEAGSDLVMTLSGNVNLSAYTKEADRSININGLTITNSPYASLRFINGNVDDYNTLFTGPTLPGNPGFNAAMVSSYIGDQFFVERGVGFNQVWLADGYISGAALSGIWTFANASFASIGQTAGTSYVWTATNGPNTDTVTWNFSEAATVPEPSSIYMLGIGAIGLVFAARKRRQTKLAA